jgi:hypothetical protein
MTSRVVRRTGPARNWRAFAAMLVAPALGCAGYVAVIWFALCVGLIGCTGGG